jgi:hypothetical protein
MKNIKLYFLAIVIAVIFNQCNYLDIVPDNVATVDNAFTMRNTAEKYLFTCYRYMPNHANLTNNPVWTAGDTFWFGYPWWGIGWGSGSVPPGVNIARGNQNKTSPYLNYWEGSLSLFRGIRDCNIFFENIDKVPDINEMEKLRWIAEVKFLKAYYHFWLLRMYGPIPVIRENLPISAGVEEVKVYREPVDTCFNYIVQLLDEAITDLPDVVNNEIDELGRITKAIAMSVKAKVLVTAASPLFNGNTDYVGFVDNRGISLFNTTYDQEKWVRAADACKEAIEICDSLGYALYTFAPAYTHTVSDETRTQMSIRNSVCDKWNSEVIWGNTNSSTTHMQQQGTPYGLDPSYAINNNVSGNLGAPLRIIEQFYSINGVPISEDKTWDYPNRYKLRVVTESEKYRLQPGYTTAVLNCDREPRFYGSLAFDGGWWFGNGRYNDNDQWVIQSKAKQLQVPVTIGMNNVTGYWPKKIIHFENVIGASNKHTVESYPWPVMRVADLYLLYAEALNEINGPSDDVYYWVNLVRERSGLPPVAEAWSQFSKTPDKYLTQEGCRAIIQQERLIELVFEGHRFWDLRRWKRAQQEMSKPFRGWDTVQEEAALYYRPKTLFSRSFLLREYFWPISEHEISVNPNLVQNLGW